MADSCVVLPQECWELIFNRLKKWDLEAISLVCKDFFSISNSLRHSLKVNDSTVPVLSQLLERFHHLKKIDLSSLHHDLDRSVLEIARSGLNLEALKISYQETLPAENLKELGSYMKNLKTLECSHFRSLRDIDLALISNSMPRLQELDISFQRREHVTDAGIQALASKLKDLRKINISGNDLSDSSLLALSSNCVFLKEIAAWDCKYITQNSITFLFCHSPNLVSLSVSNDQMENLSVSSLLGTRNSIANAKASRLRVLEISRVIISDSLLSSIAKLHIPLKKLKLCDCLKFSISGFSLLLHACQSIEELDLKGAEFLTDEHMNDLSYYLHSATYINLSKCSKLTDSTFFILTRNCPSLVELVMKRTSLGAKEDFGMDLTKNHQIQRLRLGSNEYLNDGSLKKIGFSCPNLRLLNVSDCVHTTSEGTGEIFKSCSKIGHLERNFSIWRKDFSDRI